MPSTASLRDLIAEARQIVARAKRWNQPAVIERDFLTRLADALEAERERCARICEELADRYPYGIMSPRLRLAAQQMREGGPNQSTSPDVQT